MISPVVVRVSVNGRLGGNTNLSVSLEAPPIGDQSGYELACDINDKVFTDTTKNRVRLAGELLYEGLRSNPDVQTALQQALLAQTDDRYPLLLELRGPEAVEALPWETLYLPGAGFFGLDPRWSVGRRVDAKEARPLEGILPGALHIAVILSCLGISARDEWRELHAAVTQSMLPVSMLLFVGEPDLADDLAENCPPWLRLAGIPASAEALADRFRKEAREGFIPQVLHFFCHGSNEGSAHLEIATPSDWERDATQSSLTLNPTQVRDLTDAIRRPWLVILNSCLGAAPMTDDAGAATTEDSLTLQRAATHSLARKLVQDAGFAAVVGMREPIDTTDATVFSSRLYPRLLEAFSQLPTDRPVALDWSRLLVPPRLSLAEEVGEVLDTAAAGRKQWTLPVLYLRSQELLLSRLPTPPPTAAVGGGPGNGAPVDGGPPPVVVPGAANGTPAMVPVLAVDPVTVAKLELLREMLGVLSPDAPDAFRADIERNIERLEKEAP